MTDSIIIPNTVTRIDNEAFIVCFRLEFVDFEMPSSLSSIPDGAFRRCNHLRTVRMPNSIDTIGGYAFFECDSLRGMDLPDSLKYVGTYAFYNTYNDTLIVPRGIRNVGSYPFTHIEKLLFESGDNNYNNILEDIHTCGFRYSGSYYACNRHQTVLGEYNFGQVEGYFTYLDTAKTILYKYDDEDIATSVTVPNYVIELSKNSFSNNVDLETIILHDGITKIGTGAFRYCYSLDSIILPSTLTKINDYMFSYDSSLVRLDIPDSVRSIGVEVFAGCVSLSQVNIPDAVTSIGNYAFYDCIALDSLHLGGHLQSIGNWAYTGCTNLTAITSENTTPPAISWNTFSNVPKTIPLYVPYESMSLYQSAQGWYEFTNILPIGGYPEPEGPKYDTISASICQGGDYCANGFNILNVMLDSCFERIIYTDNEIDSVITSILKVLPVYSNTVSAELCAGDDYSSHGFYFENLQESDTHTLSLQSFYGCDSSVVLYLTVNASYNPTIMADVCRGNDYVANGFNIMDVQSDSIYTQYLLSNKGCDSITLLSLLVHDTSSIMLNATICQGSDYTSDGFAIYDVQQGGSYSINYTNAQGCDSIVTLNLTMNPAYASSFHASVCQGDDYTMNGFNVTDVQTGGDYDLTMQSIRTGCDSVVTVHLSVNPTYNIPIVATTCQGSDYVENGFSLMDVQENDTLTHMLQSIQCCDSITTLFLTVTPTYDTVIEVEVEPGGSYNENGLNLDNIQEDATITDVYPTIFGCDSIVTIHIKEKDVGIREAEGTDAFVVSFFFFSDDV